MQVLRTVVLIVLACVFGCGLSEAQKFERTIAQFAHTAWGPKDGAPNVVDVLAQSSDGYLWLAGPNGLYRFDGVVFESYKPQSGGPFPARRVSSLFALPNGDLWIGFPNGISLLRNGDVRNYTTRDGVPAGVVWSFAQDRDGRIWAATESGLVRLEGNRWKDVGKDWNFPGKSAHALFLDRQGTLWVATEDSLVFLPSGARRFQLTGIAIGQVLQITQAASGKLWMAETTRSVRPIPLSDKGQPPDGTEVQVGSAGIVFDNDGALWITSLGDGLRRAPAPALLRGKIQEFSGAVESFTAKDGLSDDFVRAILEDREGNIWVGTNNGLDRFRKTNLVPVVLPFKLSYAVLAAGDAGDAWVQHLAVMVRIHGGRADRGHPVPWQAVYAYRDPAGVIWWLWEDAIYRYNTGNYTRVALPPSFPKPYSAALMAATKDGFGVLWLAAEREGLFYLEKGRWQRLETASEFANLSPRAAFTDSMGRAWFGYEEGTIIILEHENIQRVFPANDSPVGSVRAINGRGPHIWVGGELGLTFFDGNRFRRIVPADVETFGSVLGVEETSNGSLWLAESRGVIQVPASEVQQALDDPSYRVKYRIFDSLDGLPGTFAGVVNNSKEIQGTDGLLWFVASAGIVWGDPAHISTNALPPPVSIRYVRANGRQRDSLANLVLPPRTTNLQIGYTALSLAVPEKVRFRYKLEELDEVWQDVGTRREAFYTNLSPGKYRFHVIACNNDGVWNDTGATLDFRVSPAWYQTIWFRSFYVVAFGLFLWALHQLRLRQLARQFNMRLEERVGERTRIARELHDTLLQNLHGLMFQFQAASNMVHKRPADAKQTLDNAIIETEEAIAESQDAIRGLRSEQVVQTDLAQLLTAMANELARSQNPDHKPPAYRVIVEGERRTLLPVMQDEVYRIAREVLRNAFQHASAHQVEAEIHYDVHAFRLRIRDNGKGIEPEVLKKGKRAGHWGLPGIQERAQRIGAKLEVWSEAGAGTEVELTVPAVLAYETSRDHSRFRLFRRAKS